MEVDCAKASPAAPTRPSKAVATKQTRRAAKIRFRTADTTQRNCRPACRLNAAAATFQRLVVFPAGKIMPTTGDPFSIAGGY
jgi:hypothetical protein